MPQAGTAQAFVPPTLRRYGQACNPPRRYTVPAPNQAPCEPPVTATPSNPLLPRAYRQQLETTLLLGVDFVPSAPMRRAAIAQDHDGAPSASAMPGPAATLAEIKTATAPSVVVSTARSPVPVPAPSASASEKAALLAALQQEHHASCPHCTIAEGVTNLVFGEGDPDARLMFIGEAPGEEEDRTGRPFVGKAGQKLNDIIQAMGFAREQVYIANVLKARPPGNRTPLPDEIAACSPYLVRQVRIIQPSVIVALGNPAMKFLLQTDRGITSMRGMWNEFQHDDLAIPVMPTFHPSYVIRNYTPETRAKVWSDMKAVLARLAELGVPMPQPQH